LWDVQGASQVAVWSMIGLALVMALAAWMRARSVARRLEQLTQQYWDLRYQHGQLRADVKRLAPEGEPAAPDPAAEAPPQTFIPLSSLKR
jgi:hypothetical protein